MANYIELATSLVKSESQIRNENLQTSYPASFPVPEGYALVFPAPQPAHDPVTQSVREIAPAVATTGNYEQRFEVVALDADTVAANQAAKVQQDNARIKAEIAALDIRRIRPLAEGDTSFLATLNDQIAALRDQIK